MEVMKLPALDNMDWRRLALHRKNSIESVSAITVKNRIRLPPEPGVYAFWWIAERARLLNGNREIVLVGPGGSSIHLRFEEWWPTQLAYPCLYVGKTTNIKKRFSLHLKRGCRTRLHHIDGNNSKSKPVTTSCQLRYGIEHVFPTESDPIGLIETCVGFSYGTARPADSVPGRFYLEDLLIGTWRPWFNLDSER